MSQIPERVKQWMPAHLHGLEPYDPAFTPCDTILSANENNFGVPASVRDEMLAALAGVEEMRYPDALSGELRAELAAWHGVEPANVLVCNGGDEAIFNFFLAFGGGAKLLNCPPTFEVYELYGSMVGVSAHNVWRDPETLRPRWDELLAAAPSCDLAVITSPNNPTGDAVERAQVELLLEAVPGPVLVDEAYAEFTGAGQLAAGQPGTALPLLQAHPNLVVLHTLSKAFGLAGARIGYVIADPGVISALAAVRQPYSVNSFSQAAALVAVRRREEFEPNLRTLLAERSRVQCALAELPGVTLWPSDANFFLMRVPGAAQLRARLRDEHSILVRDFSAKPGLQDCLRVTVGRPEDNDALLGALGTLLG